MTAIVGWKENGEVWMGADSFCGGPEIGFSRVNPKLFRHGELLIGSCGQSRASQIIHYCIPFPEWPKELDAMDFLVSRWVPNVRGSLESHCRLGQGEGDHDINSAFLVAARGRLFWIGGDFAVDEFAVYGAAGSGESVALGALSIVGQTHVRNRMEWEPQHFIRYALEAASSHVGTVAPPFHIEKL